MKLRIAMVMDWHPYSLGGVQTHVRELSRRLQELGHEVIVVSKKVGVDERASYESEGFITVKPIIPLEIVVVPADPRELKEVIHEYSPDIVHAHHIFTPTSLLSLKVANSLGIPSVITNHTIYLGYNLRGLWRMISHALPTRYYLSYANAIISVSKAADQMVEAIIGDAVPRHVIPNAIDSRMITPPEKEPEDDVVFFIGRLVYRKGVHVLVKAFSNIVKERPEAKLVIAGKGYMEGIIRVLIKRYRLEDKVALLGPVSEEEKIRLYRGSKVVAVPSIFNESFGIVALEAMSAGRAVVATRHGGLAEIIEDGVDGMLVDPGDSKGLAKALLEVLSDENLRIKLGSNARRKIESKYSWDVVIDKIVALYKTLRG